MQLVVEPASVADRLTGLVPPPEGRGRRLAVGAAGARPSRRTLQRQFWKREDTDITPVTLAFRTIVARSSRLDLTQAVKILFYSFDRNALALLCTFLCVCVIKFFSSAAASCKINIVNENYCVMWIFNISVKMLANMKISYLFARVRSVYIK